MTAFLMGIAIIFLILYMTAKLIQMWFLSYFAFDISNIYSANYFLEHSFELVLFSRFPLYKTFTFITHRSGKISTNMNAINIF